MLILTSPAKTLDPESGKSKEQLTIPRFKKEALQLARILKKKSHDDLKDLMDISDKLAAENVTRYKQFQKEFTTEVANPAIFAFRGDVYQGLDVDDFSTNDLNKAQRRIRILSGLYGVLRPMDLMQPYRLEMGTNLENSKGSNLYEFWGDKITKALNADLKEEGFTYILNLASNEYFKAVDKKKIKGKLIKVDFREFRDGDLKFISFNAKKARGMMMHYIIINDVKELEELQGFDYDGYRYNADLSTEQKLMFTKAG